MHLRSPIYVKSMVIKARKNMKYEVCEITTLHPQDDARITRSLNSLADNYSRICFISQWTSAEKLRVNIDLITLKTKEGRRNRALYSFKVFLRACVVDARVYHFHDLDFLPFAALLKLIKRRPVIYDCHENYPEEMMNKYWLPKALRSPISFMTRHLENLLSRYISNIIVVTPSQVKRFLPICKRVYLVRNFSDIVIDDSENGNYVIYTGTLSESYGIYQILDIARQLKTSGIEIMVVDRFASTEQENEFKSRVKDENLGITFIPKVPASQMQNILKRGRVGLSPSQIAPNTSLGYHSKLTEYMACGLPIVASNVEANMFVMSKVSCGITVESRDISGYCAAIERLFSDDQFYRSCRENGFKAVVDIFSWKQEAKSLIKAIKEAK